MEDMFALVPLLNVDYKICSIKLRGVKASREGCRMPVQLMSEPPRHTIRVQEKNMINMAITSRMLTDKRTWL